MTTRPIEVTMTFRADVPTDAKHLADYGPHELADFVRWQVNLSDLDMLDVDISAFTMVSARETPRPIQPGDFVEPHSRNLDPREVLSVGRDFLTLDIMGLETERIPLDNYVLYKAGQGSL